MKYQPGHMTHERAEHLVSWAVEWFIKDYPAFADRYEVPVKPSDQAELREAMQIVMATLQQP